MKRSVFFWTISVVAFITNVGCTAGRLADPVGEPVADPAELVATLRNATLPESPLQVNFSWSLEEGGARVGGRGVVRLDAPQRARLDLFGPRGETYLTAALVDGEYRLPASTRSNVALPSPALLWSAVGILVEPRGATLSTATTSDSGAELRFESPAGEVFAYSFETAADGEPTLTALERAGRQGIVETVNIERAGDGSISRTRYRNWAEYRDLTLEVENLRETTAFEAEIWNVDAQQ